MDNGTIMLCAVEFVQTESASLASVIAVTRSKLVHMDRESQFPDCSVISERNRSRGRDRVSQIHRTVTWLSFLGFKIDVKIY